MSTNRPFFVKHLNKWHIKTVSANGKRSQKCIGSTREEAYRNWQAKPETSGVKFADVAASFIEIQERRLSQGEISKEWVKRIRLHLQCFGKANPGIGIDEIIPFTVTDYLAKKKLAPDSERTIIKDLNQCLQWAMDQGVVDKNPLAKMKKPAGRPRETTIDQSLHAKILEVCPPGFREFVLAAWESGCRPGELRHLEWSMVSPCRQYAVLKAHKTQKKTRKPRTIYFGSETVKHLLSCKAKEGYVFLNQYGEHYSQAAVCKHFRVIREKLGLKKIVAYSYRHSFAARAITSGVDPVTTAELMGHSDVQMIVSTYGHLSKERAHLMKSIETANPRTQKTSDGRKKKSSSAEGKRSR